MIQAGYFHCDLHGCQLFFLSFVIFHLGEGDKSQRCAGSTRDTLVHLCCVFFWHVCHYIHAYALFAALWNSVHCCYSVLSENVIFLSVFWSCMEVVYVIIFCIGCLLCNLETSPYRLLLILVKPSVLLNLTSRSSLQKGVPKLVACLCDCWCFSFFTYYVTTCAAASLLKWTNNIPHLCSPLWHLWCTCAPSPPRRFHTQLVALLFFTFIPRLLHWVILNTDLTPICATLLLWTFVVQRYL